jgi:hypothetical protein
MLPQSCPLESCPISPKGDIVLTPKGVGRIAVRTKGHFALATAREKTTINPNHCRLAQRADGYNCQFLPTLSDGVSLASI